MNESIVMSSPASSPTTHVGGHFLPQFVLGEKTPVHSPAQKHWSAGQTTLQSGTITKRVFIDDNALISSGGQGVANRTVTFCTPQSSSFHSYTPGSKEKFGAPPVRSLYDHDDLVIGTTTTSAVPVNDTTKSVLQSPVHTVHNLDTSIIHGISSSPANVSMYAPGRPQKSVLHATPPSPPQVDPFYMQGEDIKVDEELDPTWITVFGFPSSATSYILQQFSQYGHIVEHQVAGEGNWMHLHYQSKLQAKKALSKNGKVFGNGIMVGVTACIDKRVTEKARFANKENLTALSTDRSMNVSRSLDVSQQRTPIRPLAAAYQASTNQHQVTPQHQVPQRSTNILSKAMEYVFGW